MERYAHGGDIYRGQSVRLDFSVNLNPYGMPEAVKAALHTQMDSFQTYPDPECRLLRQKLAAHHSVAEECILCGNGADDLIYRLCFALRPREVLVCAPSFSEYEKAALAVGGKIRYHILREADDFGLTESILPEITEETSLLFLCTPNNPTGKLIGQPMLENIARRCQETGTYFVLDECFISFTQGESALQMLEKYPQMVILRAFTKLYAMAGLRLGYVLCRNLPLLDEMRRIAPCWSVSGPAQAAGSAALDCAVQEALLTLIGRERPRVVARLRELGFRVWDSDCSFLLFRGDVGLGARLRERGIAIRDCANYPGLSAGYWRIGLKLPEENDILLKAMGEVMQHG